MVKRGPDLAGARAWVAAWTTAILLSACGPSALRPAADAARTGADARSPGNRDAALDVTSTQGNHDAAQESGGAHPEAGVACRLSSDCADVPSTFCQKDSCDPSAVGTCAIVPGTRETGFCQPDTDFVCGCDGNTYAYACLAHAQAINVASSGPCPLPDGGSSCGSTADCGTGLYCKKDSCGATTGICSGEPNYDVCYQELFQDGGSGPACGCDHQNYDNDCAAASYGVSVDFEGRCPPLPSGPCTSQADCGGAGYAALVYCRPTTCGSPAGVCTSIIASCPMTLDPVCGCDGRLYVNFCFAETARVGWYDTVGGCP